MSGRRVGNKEIPEEILRELFAEPEPEYLHDLMTVDLRQEIKLAREGDKLAARNVATQLAALILPYKVDVETKRRHHYSLPSYVREYLFMALHRVGAGEDANSAFNLNKKGPAKWTVRDEIRIAYFVGRLVAMGYGGGESAKAVAAFVSDEVNAFGDPQRPPVTPFQFGLQPIHKGTAEKWHAEHEGRIATAKHNAAERQLSGRSLEK